MSASKYLNEALNSWEHGPLAAEFHSIRRARDVAAVTTGGLPALSPRLLPAPASPPMETHTLPPGVRGGAHARRRPRHSIGADPLCVCTTQLGEGS